MLSLKTNFLIECEQEKREEEAESNAAPIHPLQKEIA